VKISMEFDETYSTSSILMKCKSIPVQAGQALWVPEGWCSHISRQLECAGGKVVSPMHWLPLPTSFQLVAQCLNQLCYCMPQQHIGPVSK
jgi:hypothetical protein